MPLSNTLAARGGGGLRRPCPSTITGSGGEGLEKVQGFRVGEDIAVGHRPLMDCLAHGDLAELSADRAGEVGHLEDPLRHVVETHLLPDLTPNPVFESPVERGAGTKTDEEEHASVPGLSTVDLLSHCQALEHLGYALDLPVDLRRADPHAPRIEGCVAAAVDHPSAVFGLTGPVSMPPHPGVMVKVRAAVPGPIRVIPEPDRHAGERPGTDELPRRVHQPPPFGRPHLDRH